jgi:hypothetical protein
MADPRGRQPIGINQPPGSGTNYPFKRPSSDIQYLLGDFYLSFPDDMCQLSYPFKVAWLYGFGTNAVSPPTGFPTPTHTNDIVIQDGSGVTVFDSTTAGVSYSSSVWGTRLLIHEWVDEDSHIICRCTEHTEWTQADIDAGLDTTYDDYIVPTEGELDSRTYNKLPQRLNTVKVGLSDLSGEITLEEGYNIGLASADSTSDIAQVTLADLGVEGSPVSVVAGTRKTNYVTLSAVAGSGLGAFPSCDDVAPTGLLLRRLNGAVPDEKGNVIFHAEGCLRSKRPVTLTSVTPRTFSYGDPSLTAAEAKAALKLLNDCGPCCDCDNFVRTYVGLRRQWILYEGIAQNAEVARDRLSSNITRWEAQKLCREADPLRLSLLSEKQCSMAYSVVFGNTSKCCLRAVHFRFTVTQDVLAPATAITPYDLQKTKVYMDGQSGAVPYVLIGNYPVYEIIVPYCNPQSNTRMTFRLCFPGCSNLTRVKIRTDVYWEGSSSNEQYPNYPSLALDCNYPTVTIDSATQALWLDSSLTYPAYSVRYAKETKLMTLNDHPIYCAPVCPPAFADPE